MVVGSATAIYGAVDGHEVEAYDGYGEGESGSWVVVRCRPAATDLFSHAVVRKVRNPQRAKWQRRGRLLPRPDGLFVHVRGKPEDVEVWLGKVGGGLLVAPERTQIRPDGSLRLPLIGERFTADLVITRIRELISVCDAMGS
jgi:hypothetical protein